MSNSKQHIIFNESENISDELIVRYVNDAVTAEERRKVELSMADDEILFDTIEGLLKVKDKSKIDEITTGIKKTVGEDKSSVIPITRSTDYKKYFMIASSLLLILGMGYFFNNNFKQENSQAISQNLTAPTPPASEDKLIQSDEAPISPEEEKATISRSSEVTSGEKNEGGESQTQEKLFNDIMATTPAAVNKKVSQPDQIAFSADMAVTGTAAQPMLKATSEMDKSIDANLTSGKAVFEPKAAKDEQADGDNFTDNSKLALQENKNLEVAQTTTTVSMNSAPAIAETESVSKSSAKKGKVKTRETVTEKAAEEQAGKAKAQVQSKTASADDGLLVAGYYKKNDSVDADETDYQNALQHISKKEFKKAEKLLDKILKNKTSKKFEDAQWQKALVLEQFQKYKECKDLLQSIITTKGKYAVDAQKKLDVLKDK